MSEETLEGGAAKKRKRRVVRRKKRKAEPNADLPVIEDGQAVDTSDVPRGRRPRGFQRLPRKAMAEFVVVARRDVLVPGEKGSTELLSEALAARAAEGWDLVAVLPGRPQKVRPNPDGATATVFGHDVFWRQ